MKNLTALLALFTIMSASPALAHDADPDQQSDKARKGYVLKVGEGEILGSDIIKASPVSGTQGGVVILQRMTSGFSTGLHVHVEADEFFYIISGRGRATIGSERHPIEAGDVIFVPSGQVHKIVVPSGETLEVLEFLDRPGLDEEFRTWHRAVTEGNAPVTLEQVNAIAEKYGTVYKSLD